MNKRKARNNGSGEININNAEIHDKRDIRKISQPKLVKN